MSSISFNITQSDTVLNNNISANSQLTMSIVNPLEGASYFTLETIPDNNGFYTSSTPKNLSGSFIVDSNTVGIVKDDYKMSAVVKPGTTNIVFTPAINVVGSTVKVRGVSGIQSTGPIFDADYQAVLNYAVTQGYTLPSPSQQIKQNQLVLDLKSAGIWSLMDTIYVYATDGDRNYAKLNWKSPSLFFCTEINSPTFTTNQGFIGNGTSSYLNTNWNAVTNGVNFQLNNASMIIYAFAVSGVGTPFNGVASGNFQGFVSGTGQTQRINTASSLSANIDMSGTGYKSLNKTASLNITGTNGTNQQDRTVSSDNSFNENHFILRRGGLYGAHTISYAAYGSNMKSYDSIYNTILTNYITSL